jgi:hypothetical protein
VNRQASRLTSGLRTLNPTTPLLKRPPRSLPAISRVNSISGIRLHNIARPLIPCLFVPDHNLGDILAYPEPHGDFSVPLLPSDDVEVRVLRVVEAVFLQAASQPAYALWWRLVVDVEDLHAYENEDVVGAVTVLRHDARVVVSVVVDGLQGRKVQGGFR